jgi:hypothetical protein
VASGARIDDNVTHERDFIPVRKRRQASRPPRLFEISTLGFQ